MFPLQNDLPDAFNTLSLAIEDSERRADPFLVRCAALDNAQRECIALITGIFQEQISAIDAWLSTPPTDRDSRQITQKLSEEFERLHEDYVADFVSLLKARDCVVENGKVYKLSVENRTRLTQECSEQARKVFTEQINAVDFTQDDVQLRNLLERLKRHVSIKQSQADTILDQKTRITMELHQIMQQTTALCRLRRQLITSEPKDVWTACEVGSIEFLNTECPREGDLGPFLSQMHPTGVSLLHIAARHKQFEIAQWLITLGASVLQPSSAGYLPLHWAAQQGDLDTLKLLLEHAPESVNATGEYGRTPLHMAAHNGHVDCAQMLLKRRAEINAQEYEGITPLHEAVMCDDEAMVTLLLQHDAVDVNLTNSKRFTALAMAIANGNRTLATLIIGHASWKPQQPIEELLRMIPANTEAANADAITSLLRSFYGTK